MDLWAVVPVKERVSAKERLAPMLRRETRQALALAMLEDVLAALTATPGVAGLLVVTVDAEAGRLAASYGGRVIDAGARDGHTGAVAAAMRLLAVEGRQGMLTLPGDIPLVTSAEIARLLASHPPAPSFTIVPSHDEQGSNAIACSPPDAVPLRFGENSFYPHLEAAEARGIRPNVLHLPGIALDIDNPEDVVSFMRIESRTRARAVLAEERMQLVGGFRR
jgi:2-phospho-L-lactate/phosphoenolpyruvate guanylyltransferase